MFRPSWKSLWIGAIVAAVSAVGVAQADACWGWGCYSPGCWGYAAYYTPVYTPYYTVSYDPCWSTSCGWSVGVRPGPIRRLLFGPYRWYYGCWGGYSGSCWDVCYTDVCCGEVGTVAPTPAAQPVPTEAKKPPAEPGPIQPPELPGPEPGPEPSPTMPEATPGQEPPEAPMPPSKVPETPAGSEPTTFRTRGTSGLLTVFVPDDARVTVNGLPTRSKGTRRQYVSYGLQPGFSYKYEIRAEVLRDGRVLSATRTVVLTAGDRREVAMSLGPGAAERLAAR